MERSSENFENVGIFAISTRIKKFVWASVTVITVKTLKSSENFLILAKPRMLSDLSAFLGLKGTIFENAKFKTPD